MALWHEGYRGVKNLKTGEKNGRVEDYDHSGNVRKKRLWSREDPSLKTRES